METLFTIFKIFAIIYLLFFITVIIFNKWWQVKVIMRWANTYVVMFLAHFLIPLYPIAYATRNNKRRILSWLLDDGRYDGLNYAKDYKAWLVLKGYHGETWWSAFRWHVERNRLYNLLESFRVYNGDPLIGNQFITVIETVIDKLYKNDKNFTHIAQDGIYVASAGLKYIGSHDLDPWQINQGEIISIKTSILGTGFIWFRVEYKDKNGKIKFINYFRYSQCKIVKYPLFGSYYRTLRAGTNSARNSLTMKHQKIKPWN